MPELAPRHPRRLVAALFVGVLLTVSLTGCTALGELVLDRVEQFTGGGDDTGEYDPESAYDEGNTDLNDIEVGECVDDEAIFGDADVASLDVVDCDEPHIAELYALWNLPDEAYPGYYAVNELIEEGCEERFENFVGAPSVDTDLAYYYFYPTEDYWEYDRGAMCFAIDYDQKSIVGSVRDRGASTPEPSEG
ncbi:hypothetical protein EYE40_01865 [Glaciihabitans arcticus]|uniref:Septum formation-related domain-containing protein n=1 Tax=Glaciihabitans arcticus TaxID=2668039 RepID=A0A4Q9GVN5_9MICO|nr:septum formation family protein [Glaciihabitans arcticus]TBN56240.1 hypothetical protein EYE40_01865 [Glaciihabitans arcticus]